eukprot:c3560_g1_i1.p1 GENE.c3560_g1_i1~~c3560_g1_i1.p1  ORF type:complete len:274 (-),score=49.64 c3560_g1_i1:155-976(-)
MQSFVTLLCKFAQLKVLGSHKFGESWPCRFGWPSVLSRRLQFELNVTESVFVFAAALIQRLYTSKPEIFRELSASEMIVSCCTISMKFLHEMNTNLKTLAEVAAMTTKRLMYLERRVFQAIGFDAYVSIETYSSTVSLLMALSNTAFVCLNLDDPFGARESDRPLRTLEFLEHELDHPTTPPQLPPIDSVLSEHSTTKKRPPELQLRGRPRKRQHHLEWEASDDEMLSVLVQRHGTDNWGFISLFFDGRTPSECQLRFSRAQLFAQETQTYND